MVGASELIVAHIRPVLETMGTDVTHCGPVGCGQVVKILNNMLVFQNTAALAEAMAIGRRNGVSPDLLLPTIAKGSGDSFVLRSHGMKAMLAEDFPERAFSTRYAMKDLRYALEMAEASGVVVPGAQLAMKRLREAERLGYGDRYHPSGAARDRPGVIVEFAAPGAAAGSGGWPSEAGPARQVRASRCASASPMPAPIRQPPDKRLRSRGRAISRSPSPSGGQRPSAVQDHRDQQERRAQQPDLRTDRSAGVKELWKKRPVEQQGFGIGQPDQKSAHRDLPRGPWLRDSSGQIDDGRPPLPNSQEQQIGHADPADPLEPHRQCAQDRGQPERGQAKLDNDRGCWFRQPSSGQNGFLGRRCWRRSARRLAPGSGSAPPSPGRNRDRGPD